MNKKILIFFLLLISPLKAEQFRSIKNFTFELPEGYVIFNKSNLYDVYNHSNKDKRKTFIEPSEITIQEYDNWSKEFIKNVI